MKRLILIALVVCGFDAQAARHRIFGLLGASGDYRRFEISRDSTGTSIFGRSQAGSSVLLYAVMSGDISPKILEQVRDFNQKQKMQQVHLHSMSQNCSSRILSYFGIGRKHDKAISAGWRFFGLGTSNRLTLDRSN